MEPPSLAGNCFEIIGNFVIFCNTFVVGWQAEKTPRNTTDQDSTWECKGFGSKWIDAKETMNSDHSKRD